MSLDDHLDIKRELVQLARLSLIGRKEDLQLYIRRLARRFRESMPSIAKELGDVLREVPTHRSPLRNATMDAIPVDTDTRLQLARVQYPVLLDLEPVWKENTRRQLEEIISERLQENELNKVGLHPTRTALFFGPPGVGKTLAARWIANKLDKPLIILDLSAVISSFLGRTGVNVRHVLDYAKGISCVLLLDEFDAIAKRRDDIVEIGELKRLVTVLLQEIDDWPPTSLLIAATNHDSLLDRAVWRRFEALVDFPMPDEVGIRRAVSLFLGEVEEDIQKYIDMVALGLSGLSYSDIERELLRIRREAVIQRQPIGLALKRLVTDRLSSLSREQRARIAVELMNVGYSQREANRVTGVSRDTIRKLQGVPVGN